MDIKLLRKAILKKEYRLTFHVIKRCDQRGITLENIEQVILQGEIIEEYPDDKPYPSCLITGKVKDGVPLYAVCAYGEQVVHIITAHWLDPKKWLDAKTRRDKG